MVSQLNKKVVSLQAIKEPKESLTFYLDPITKRALERKLEKFGSTDAKSKAATVLVDWAVNNENRVADLMKNGSLFASLEKVSNRYDYARVRMPISQIQAFQNTAGRLAIDPNVLGSVVVTAFCKNLVDVDLPRNEKTHFWARQTLCDKFLMMCKKQKLSRLSALSSIVESCVALGNRLPSVMESMEDPEQKTAYNTGSWRVMSPVIDGNTIDHFNALCEKCGLDRNLVMRTFIYRAVQKGRVFPLEV